MLKIGEVAKKTGVSIRSLRHYDKLGLLKPKHSNEAGYRLYDKEDIYRLQQIISLKQMKIPLQKIKSMLLEDTLTLKQTLQMQHRYLQQQLAQYKSLCSKVDHLLARLFHQETLSLELIYQTMENIKMLEKYYSPEQLEALEQRDFHHDAQKAQEYSKAWQEVFSGLEQLRLAKIEPASEETKDLVIQSRKLLAEFIDGDESIENSINTMTQQEGGAQMLRHHGLEVSDALFEYYEAAVHAHAKRG